MGRQREEEREQRLGHNQRDMQWRRRQREGAPPEKRAITAHGMQGRGGGAKSRGSHQGTPQAACAPSARHAGTGGGGTLQPEGEGGKPPEQACMPFMRGLIQEMKGNTQDL